MVSYTFYVRANLCIADFPSIETDIVLRSDESGRVFVAFSDRNIPQKEATVCMHEDDMRLDVIKSEVYYIVSNKIHKPYHPVAEMFADLLQTK